MTWQELRDIGFELGCEIIAPDSSNLSYGFFVRYANHDLVCYCNVEHTDDGGHVSLYSKWTFEFYEEERLPCKYHFIWHSHRYYGKNLKSVSSGRFKYMLTKCIRQVKDLLIEQEKYLISKGL